MDSPDFSKYEIINEENKSTHLDILDNNEQDHNIKTTQLSQIHLPVKEKDPIENKKDENIDNPHYGDQSKSISVHNLLYGNPIDLMNPKYIGKSFAFLYDFKGDPKITIGPDCKLKNIKLFYFYS